MPCVCNGDTVMQPPLVVVAMWLVVAMTLNNSDPAEGLISCFACMFRERLEPLVRMEPLVLW